MPSAEYQAVLQERFGDVREVVLEVDLLRWSMPARRAAGLMCRARLHRTRHAIERLGCCCPSPEERRLIYAEVVRRRKARRGRRPADLRSADWKVARYLAAGYVMPGANLSDRKLAAILLYRTGHFTFAEIGARVGKQAWQVQRYCRRSGELRLTGPAGWGGPRRPHRIPSKV